jgi:hypothetical protein
MTTPHPASLTSTLARDALFADARRRALGGRQAAQRLAWARLARLVRQWAHRLLPPTTTTPSLPPQKAC